MVKHALVGKHGEYEMVLTNPPFGKKSSFTIVNEAGDEERQSLVVHRDDFWASTSKGEPHRHYNSASSSTFSPC
jgi:type I restriction enzyme M protein